MPDRTINASVPLSARVWPLLLGLLVAALAVGLWYGERRQRLALESSHAVSPTTRPPVKQEPESLSPESLEQATASPADEDGTPSESVEGSHSEPSRNTNSEQQSATAGIVAPPEESPGNPANAAPVDHLQAILQAHADHHEALQRLQLWRLNGTPVERAAADWVLRELTGSGADRRHPTSRSELDEEAEAVGLLAAQSHSQLRLWSLYWSLEILRTHRGHARTSTNVAAYARMKELLPRLMEDPDPRVAATAQIAAVVDASDKQERLAAVMAELPEGSWQHALSAIDRFNLQIAALRALKDTILKLQQPEDRAAGMTWLARNGRYAGLQPNEWIAVYNEASDAARLQLAQSTRGHGNDEALLRMSRDQVPGIRRVALEWARQKVPNRKDIALQPIVLRILGPLAHDKQREIATDALKALALHAGPELGFELEDAYDRALAWDDDPQLQMLIMAVLQRYGRPLDRQLVLEGMKSDNAAVAMAAFEAAAQLPGADMVEGMVELCRDDNSYTYRNRIESLLKERADEMTDDELKVLVDGMATIPNTGQFWRLLMAAGDRDGSRTTPMILPYLTHDDPEIRARIAGNAVRLGKDFIRPHLRNLADDPEAKVRAELVSGYHTWPPDDPVIEKLIADPDAKVRYGVARQLQYGVEDNPIAVRPRALRLLNDPDKQVREVAIHALFLLGDREIDDRCLEVIKKHFPRGVDNVMFQCMVNGNRQFDATFMTEYLKVGEPLDYWSAVSSINRNTVKPPYDSLVRELLRHWKFFSNWDDSRKKQRMGNVEYPLRRLLGKDKLTMPDDVEKWLEQNAE